MRDEKLSIVLCCQSLGHGKGGAERVTVELANEMSRRGHMVHVAYAALTPRVSKPAYPLSSDCYALPWGPAGLTSSKFNSAIRQASPDVIMLFYATWQGWCLYEKFKDFGVPLAYQECSNPERIVTTNWQGKASAQEERDALAATGCRVRVTMSDYKNSFPSWMQPNVWAFPNAFPLNSHLDLEQRKNKKQKSIIHIGGAKLHKNLKALVVAFARVTKEYPDWDIKICGKFSMENESICECIDYAEKYGFRNKLNFLGLVEDMAAVYQDSDIHVITSLSEGCPNCVCEAMTNALPTIGFKECAGTNQLVVNEHNGVLVDNVLGPAALADALRKLMGDTDLREQLGKNALEDASAFSPEKIFDTWEAFFYDAASYKENPNRLLEEQLKLDGKGPLKAEKLRKNIIRTIRIRHYFYFLRRGYGFARRKASFILKNYFPNFIGAKLLKNKA